MQRKLTLILQIVLATVTCGCLIGCSNAVTLRPGCEDLSQLTFADVEEEILWDPKATTGFQDVQDGDIASFAHTSDENETESVPPTHSAKVKRGATKNKESLWPNGIIYYNISHSYTCEERATILKALCLWEERTCIRFVQRISEKDYITIFPGAGCSSYVGKLGKNQGVSVGRSCFGLNTVLHEIGHAIGFFHEHSRPDRDDYVDILYDNIIEGAEKEFKKKSKDVIDSLGVPYDYNSIMHYKHNLFAKSAELNTIVADDSNIPIGGSRELSDLDILQTNLLYQCPEVLPPRSTACPPENPSTPIPFPELPYPNCGGTIEITRKEWEREYTIESPNFPTYTPSTDCVWFIRVPKGFQVMLTLEPISIKRSSRCKEDFITIYESDGYHNGNHCGNENNYTISSAGNFAHVKYHTGASQTPNELTSGLRGFRATVRAIDVNECSRGEERDPCSHGCKNLNGSYECFCPEGYFLSSNGQECFDTNECALGNGGCDHKCVNRGGWYHCECDDGFALQSDGKTCLFNSTQRTTLSDICLQAGCDQLCGVVGGVARCACKTGYALASDGRHCEDRNECATANGGCEHICTNTDGSFECSCREGYRLVSDGMECEDIDECATENGGCDHICKNRRGYYECHCKTGHRLLSDGKTCQVFYPDLPYPNCGGIIEITEDKWDEIHIIQSPNYPEYTQNVDCGWFIRVPEGFQIDVYIELMSINGRRRSKGCHDDYLQLYEGPNFSTVDYNVGKLCGNHRDDFGFSTLPNTAYLHYHAGSSGSPDRFKGFKAKISAYDTNECRWRNTCSGTNFICTNTLGSFTCSCPENFFLSADGKNCNAAEPCDQGYARSPATGQCEDVNECATGNDNCDHFCTNTIGSFECSCREGYYLLSDGKGCLEINECATNNGGCDHTCRNTAGSFECSCDEGFRLSIDGKACEELTVSPSTESVQVTTLMEEADGIDIPIPECGAILRESSGSFESPNWPQTYPTNVLCEWTIVLPDKEKRVEINFNPGFGIAGRLPECRKDWVKMFDGLEEDAAVSGPHCYYTKPRTFVSSGHIAKLVLFAGPKHNKSRKGFSATFRSV